QQLRGEVLAVGDDLGGQLVEVQGRLQEPAAHGVGLALPEPGPVGHGAEEVIDVADAPAYGLLDLREGGVLVPRVAADPGCPAGADEALGAGQLRRDGGGDDAVGEVEVLAVLGGLGGADGPSRVAAAGLAAEVGAVEVGAEDGRPSGPFLLERSA